MLYDSKNKISDISLFATNRVNVFIGQKNPKMKILNILFIGNTLYFRVAPVAYTFERSLLINFLFHE